MGTNAECTNAACVKKQIEYVHAHKPKWDGNNVIGEGFLCCVVHSPSSK